MSNDRSFKTTPIWALHKRLYDWVLSLAHKKHSSLALFFLSFAEASFFPLAPDILQIALTIERPNNAWKYASISLVGTVLGAILGYLIGMVTWHYTASFFFTYIFSQETFNTVEVLYHQHSFWSVFIAAFTPIPFKIFTIAAGVFHVPFLLFVIASIIGRGARFYLVAALLHYYGPSVKGFIEKYFNLLSVIFVALLAAGFFIINYFK